MSVKTDLTELVVAAQSGDIDAFNELYNQSAPDLKYVGYSILHKKEDVEDALQETYITIYRSFSDQGISPIHDPEKFLPWARQIMRNTCLNLIDHQKRKAGKDDLRPMTSEDGQLGMDKIDNYDEDLDFSPADAAETEYVRTLLNDAISEIPAIRQTCLALHQQGLKYREIGEQLDIPEGTVKSHVRYAKAQLKKAIKEIEDEEGVQLHGVVLLRGPKGIQALVRAYTRQSWISAEIKLENKKKKARKALLSQTSKRAFSVALVSICMVIASVLLSMVPNPPVVTTSAPKIKIVQGGKEMSKVNPVNKVNRNQEMTTIENTSDAEGNEFYNPYYTVTGDGVQIVPYHVWYQGEKMYADCYVVNSNDVAVSNIKVDELRIETKSGMLGDATFGQIGDFILAPGQYIIHRFVFQKGMFEKKDLSEGISFNAQTSWNYSSNEDDSSDESNNILIISDDKVSAPTYAKVIKETSATKEDPKLVEQLVKQQASQELNSKEENQAESTEQQPTNQPVS